MIFDLVFVQTFSSVVMLPFPSISHMLTALPIYTGIRCEKYEISENPVFASWLTRNDGETATFNGDDVLIIIIGEIMSRSDSKYFGPVTRFLSAQDILGVYNFEGHGLVHHIKGNFQLLIHQKRDKKTAIVNSRGGVSPFYCYRAGDTLVASTAIHLFPDEIKRKLIFSSAHILEYAMFNYPLGEHTLFENVHNVLPGEIVEIGPDYEKKHVYYDVSDFLCSEKIDKGEAVEEGSRIFHAVVNSYLTDKAQYCASLTGGFDGRAILSVADIAPEKILLYSFGIQGSENISIPLEISKQMGYEFKPYYLDDVYANRYPEYAKATCLLTDCLATVQRANYLYVFEDLSKFSDTVITGIFGSELMRTFQNAGLMISTPAANVLRDKDPIERLRSEIRTYPYRHLWGADVFSNSSEEAVIQSFREKYLQREYVSVNHRIFTYFIKDALRKWFGGEVHAERVVATNRFPFFDDEFVEFMLKSPFSALNNTFLDPSYHERIRSQLYYAMIMRRFKPDLLKFRTDHGYAPKYLFWPFPLLFIGPQVYVRSKLKKRTGYKEFNSEEWAEGQFKEHNSLFVSESVLNMKAVKTFFDSGEWKKDVVEMRKLFSFQLYSDAIGKGFHPVAQ